MIGSWVDISFFWLAEVQAESIKCNNWSVIIPNQSIMALAARESSLTFMKIGRFHAFQSVKSPQNLMLEKILVFSPRRRNYLPADHSIFHSIFQHYSKTVVLIVTIAK